MATVQEIFDQMNDTVVSSAEEKQRLEKYYRKQLLEAYKAENPDMEVEDIEDEIDMQMEGWSEVTWTDSDWADYYGVDEEDLEDAMDSDDYFDD